VEFHTCQKGKTTAVIAGQNVQRAYDHIRDRIIAGDFPPGAVVSEAALAKELGLSRTPVGEALRDLASVGLVEQVPRYGTIVRRISRPEIVELYELREGLEPHAVSLAVRRISPEDIERLQKLCDRLEDFLADLKGPGRETLDGPALREFLAADMAFHTLLIHAAGNRRIAKLVRDSQMMTELFGTQRHVHDRKIVAEACRFHTRILAAVHRGDADTARALAAQHIHTSLLHTLENLDRYRGSDDLAAVALPDDVREELNRIESGMARPSTEGPSTARPIAERPRKKTRR
jgi:DNA-binding GntR family transcriptional regulator